MHAIARDSLREELAAITVLRRRDPLADLIQGSLPGRHTHGMTRITEDDHGHGLR
jgi:hypothetical protein